MEPECNKLRVRGNKCVGQKCERHLWLSLPPCADGCCYRSIFFLEPELNLGKVTLMTNEQRLAWISTNRTWCYVHIIYGETCAWYCVRMTVILEPTDRILRGFFWTFIGISVFCTYSCVLNGTFLWSCAYGV